MLPVYSLEAAAGYFGEGKSVDLEGWIEVEQFRKLDEDTFVAQALGRSMEPKIRDGDFLVFRAHAIGNQQGKIVLARGSITGPELGGSFTVKKYSSEKVQDHEIGWVHSRITLSPLNREFDPIQVETDGEDDSAVQVIAQLVDKLKL